MVRGTFATVTNGDYNIYHCKELSYVPCTLVAGVLKISIDLVWDKLPIKRRRARSKEDIARLGALWPTATSLNSTVHVSRKPVQHTTTVEHVQAIERTRPFVSVPALCGSYDDVLDVYSSVAHI